MKSDFKESFLKDVRKIKEHAVKLKIQEAIEAVEAAPTLSSVPNMKKLKTGSSYYRIKVGDHRIGIAYECNTVIFIRALHRKDIYRYFPMA